MSGKASKASSQSSPAATKRPQRPRRTLLSTILILTPLLFLVVDLIAFPLFLDPRPSKAGLSAFGPSAKKTVSVSALLVERVVPVGAFNSYRIYLSLDDLASPRPLEYLEGQGNALAISHFVNPEAERSEGSSIGSLGRAVLQKLAEVSPEDRAALWHALERMHRHAPGDVVEVSLHIPRAQYRKFPLDHLFIVLLDEYVSDEILSEALTNLFRKAEQRKVTRLVLPCLGYRWDDKRRSLAGYFDAVFAAVPPAGRPRDLYLSLYRRWPTFVLENAVSSLNVAPPAERTEFETGFLPESGTRLPYRHELRLLLLLLPLCLLVCSLRIPITLRNFVLITVGLVGACLGSKELLAFFTQGLEEVWQLGAQVVVWLLIAAFFPFLVRWNPSELFEEA